MATHAIKFARGATHVETMLAVNEFGARVDLTGAQLLFSLRPIPGSDLELMSKDTASGLAADPDQVVNKGKYTLTFAHADTITIATPCATYWYDVWAILADGSYVEIQEPSQLTLAQVVAQLP